MKEHCVRGGTWVGSGDKKRWLSFCEVNYNYADQVYKYSQKYKAGKDNINFYYIKKSIEKPIEIKEKPIINNGKKEDPPKIEPPKKLSFFDKIVAFFKSIFSRK